ncbi:MAG: beta-glycosidase [Bacteroidales bacterium]|nr:discoidin domain-containing protein [Bacteroidota bacterium]NLN98773.1 beta-glycosidase [Bacteroidales bacterium]
MKNSNLLLLAFFALLFSSCSRHGSRADFTRGIGEYPGKVDEYAGPALITDSGTYRNLAFRRAAYHSSSYDYNLTGHLVTDGIVTDQSPVFLAVSTSDGLVAKRDRERLFDNNRTSLRVNGGRESFLCVDLRNGSFSSDQVKVTGVLECDLGEQTGYHWYLDGLPEKGDWVLLGEKQGAGLPGDPTVQASVRAFDYVFQVPGDLEFTSYRLRMEAGCVKSWEVRELNFLCEGKGHSPLPARSFRSAWMSGGAEDEWLYVDLGAEAEFDKIVLSWIRKPLSGQIETSSDAVGWKKLADLSLDESLEQTVPVNGAGRYVRLSGLKADKSGYILLSELEVYGKGGVVPVPKPQASPVGNRLYLSGGNWRLERVSQVEANGEAISTPGFPADDWLVATVPGTVATSYFNAGAIPDIRYDDDQLQISESYFYSDFWYRDVFELPSEYEGTALALNFDGINWKADIYFNGVFAGHIDGAFTRARLDVTSLAKAGTNVLAVKVFKNDNPGIVKEKTRQFTDLNGGELGADNPTMHCTIGWDWIPTVRGRNIGIWNDVYLASYPGGVSIDDVFIPSDLPLPSVEYADLAPVVTLTNYSKQQRSIDVHLQFGDLPIETQAILDPGESRDVNLPVTRVDQPQLWWPVGYGEPYLYDVQVTASVAGNVSDIKRVKTGIREMSYKTDGGVLDLYINNRRLVANGGNWGYPEINLNYRAREYDAVVAYHADMNFTMIRNWVCQTGDEELYDACDRHGVMVWQDFWLANPWDGPDPDDAKMFLDNAEDYLRKVRNHPCIALYVGRNEGDPPSEIDNALMALMERLHPSLFYIPNSASGMVSGGGPYRALAPQEYFSIRRGSDRIHSERGMPNMMVFESMQRMLREKNQWPQNAVWGMHDFTLENAQSAATFNALVEKAFGKPRDLKQFTEWAQWINYDGYRAIFESRSRNRKGVLLWMSHSCWPSLVWDTYDYYLEPSAAYFGAKKACAPVHIQWNPVTDSIEVVNNHASDLDGLTASAAIVNFDGEVLYEQSEELSSRDDSTLPLFPLSLDQPGLAEVYFIKLQLMQGDTLLADNFYWLGQEAGNLTRLHSLPVARLDFASSLQKDENGEWTYRVTIRNATRTPALMIRLKAQRSRSGESILPVLYEDNYFSLLPGEEKTVRIRFKEEDTGGERPRILLEGFNVKQMVK